MTRRFWFENSFPRGAVGAALALGVWVAFAACGDAEPASEEAPEEQSESELDERSRIRRFWQSNREANRLRLAGDYEAAAESFRQALKINPEHLDSLYYLGVALKEQGEYQRAESVYRRMLEVNPESNRAVSQLAALLGLLAPGSSPDFNEARDWLERSVELNREHSGVSLSLGRLLLLQREYEQAIESFEAAAGYGSAEGDLSVGFVELLRGNRPAARKRFEAVLAAAAREQERMARGEKAEGDTRAGSGGASSPLGSAADRARLLLAWVSEKPAQERPRPAWTDITAKVGLPSNGGRASWADYDGDGWTDVLIAGPGPARLYRNRRGRFEPVGVAALRTLRDVWDSAWGDFDGDGDLDLYLYRPGFVGQGENHLLRNDGGGEFTLANRGLEGERSTMAAAFADLDGDGSLEIVEAGAAGENGRGLRIFRWREGAWSETSSEWGVSFQGTAVDIEIADFDGDGLQDLFLLPWKKPVVLYRNQGGGRFRDVTEEAGLGGVRGHAYASVRIDYNADGREDLAWADFSDSVGVGSATAESPLRLFRNAGGGTFEAVDLPGLSDGFGALDIAAGDVDGDGFPDLLTASGSLSHSRLGTSSVLLNRAGKTFEVGARLPTAQTPTSSTGVSTADIDRDGRLEIYLSGDETFGESDFGRSYLLKRRR